MKRYNRGVTLVELVIVVVLVLMMIPLIWNNIQGSLDDSISINAKVVVQTSVNSLMNQIQKDIQEAKIPVTNLGDSGGVVSEVVINKPGEKKNVKYTHNGSQKRVTYDVNVKADGTNAEETTTYENIAKFEVKRIGNNGVEVVIRGEAEGSKTGYDLSNTYYTRNTI